MLKISLPIANYYYRISYLIKICPYALLNCKFAAWPFSLKNTVSGKMIKGRLCKHQSRKNSTKSKEIDIIHICRMTTIPYKLLSPRSIGQSLCYGSYKKYFNKTCFSLSFHSLRHLTSDIAPVKILK